MLKKLDPSKCMAHKGILDIKYQYLLSWENVTGV